MARPRSGGPVEAPKVLEKALRVLDAFSSHRPVWSEVDLREYLGIPSTTLNRILRSLESAGYLLRREGGRYQLGIAAVRLGIRAGETLDLAAVLEPIVREVNRQVDELTMLAVPELSVGRARYLVGFESSHRLRVASEVGASVPLQTGATAKALLAFQSPEIIDATLARAVEPIAAGTIADPQVIREQLEEIRKRGWAFSWEETYDGAWALGAPLLDKEGRSAFASIGVATPTSRHSPESEQRIREVLMETAKRAARELGYGLPAFMNS